MSSTDTDTRGTQEGDIQLPARVPLVAGASIAAIIPRTPEEVWRIAKAVIEAGWAPKGIDTIASAAVCIMHGAEVGLPPMASLQSIANINNRPTIYGDGALAVCLRVIERITETQHEVGTDAWFARCTIVRNGRKVTREFSKKDAIVAGLWGKRTRSGDPTPWVSYPGRMLQMRARAFCMRDTCPDALKGLAIREEVEDIGPAAEASVVPPPPPPSEPAQTPLEQAITKAKKKRAAEPVPPAPPPLSAHPLAQPMIDSALMTPREITGAGEKNDLDLVVWDDGAERPATEEDLPL